MSISYMQITVESHAMEIRKDDLAGSPDTYLSHIYSVYSKHNAPAVPLRVHLRTRRMITHPLSLREQSCPRMHILMRSVCFNLGHTHYQRCIK